MIADMMYGTHWAPGDPAPKVWSEAATIWHDFPAMHGTATVSTFMPKTEAELAAAAAKVRCGADGDLAGETMTEDITAGMTAETLVGKGHAAAAADDAAGKAGESTRLRGTAGTAAGKSGAGKGARDGVVAAGSSKED